MRNIFSFIISLFLISFFQSAASGGTMDIKQYQWKNRVLLQNSHPQSKMQWSFFEKRKEENQDRQLILLQFESKNELGALKQSFNKDEFKMLLIGKDGSVKKTYLKPTPMDEIYEVIDSMPMRQEEMKSKQGNL